MLIGVILLITSNIIRFIAFGYEGTPSERVRDLMELSNLITQIGTLIIGIGIFLSIRKIYQKLEMPRVLPYLNYTYLILLTPYLYFIYLTWFEKTLTLSDYSGQIKNMYYFGIFVLPGIRKVLLAIMFVFIFIAIVKRERSEETYPAQEQLPDDQSESDL